MLAKEGAQQKETTFAQSTEITYHGIVPKMWLLSIGKRPRRFFGMDILLLLYFAFFQVFPFFAFTERAYSFIRQQKFSERENS